jgi:hypothetical protein
MVNHRTYRHRIAPALVLVASLSAAGCTSKNATPAATPSTAATTASPTPSVDPSTAAATQDAIAAYTGYIQTFAIDAQAADPNDANLARYVADPLLGLTRHNLQTMKDRGEVQVGAQQATVTSTQVDLNSAQPVVTIHACLDYSALKLVYKANHSPVPNSQITNPKVSAIATVWLYKSGQWLVNNTKQGTDTC